LAHVPGGPGAGPGTYGVDGQAGTVLQAGGARLPDWRAIQVKFVKALKIY